MVVELGKPIAQVVRDLGVNEGTLGNWVAKWRDANPQDDIPLSACERAQWQADRRELAEVRMENEFLKKPRPSSPRGTRRRKGTSSSAAKKGNFPVAWMCRKLEVARSSYYEWKRGRGVLNSSARRRADLAGVVHEIFQAQRGRAGARGITAEMRRRGHQVLVKLVARVMKDNGLRAVQPRAYKRTTVRGEGADELVLDLVEQDFSPASCQPGEVVVGDITYLKTSTGWLYLATVIDLATRMVLGWQIGDHMRTPLVTGALAMALGNGALPGCVFHSDRGSQYTSRQFAQFCENNFVYQSMGRVATCYDNAVAESFFATLKVEFYYQKPHCGGIATKHEVGEWISFYNQTRFHSTLGYITPAQAWTDRMAASHTLAA